ncbi:protein kinase family protein [Paenibacillus thermoaerophilus]|uniref:Protein kinase family protein n=1 Tax=Paenibacillus thermoaerophilus TaxID=1215385 RepID=A0ABW2V4X4_9BACL|nr:protein kinase family protein [Paenibacillus thermoaerophilus]TMV18381.1 protein kinase family protein [Paenibacillus thermoaerophilus]
MDRLIALVERELLPGLRIESVRPHDPIEVRSLPEPWLLVGKGNYAAVVSHPEAPGQVVKIYAPGRNGAAEEREVYRKLGRHPAYSECYGAGDRYLILKRMEGVTVFDCLHRGLPVPEQAIRDIDEALDYARSRGLFPSDIHPKNMMVNEGRGLVIDVSDFLRPKNCFMWDDFKKAYYRCYAPLLAERPLPLPLFVLNGVRKGYRLWKSGFRNR